MHCFVSLAPYKRQREDHIITTEGPLHSHQGVLMFPVRERNIFQEVESAFLSGRSFIIHGPYQSGKSTFLLELKETLKCQRLNYVYFSMPSIKGAILKGGRDGFFSYLSYLLFEETLDETATFGRVFGLGNPLYLIIDEFQYIFTDPNLCDVTKLFFREISGTEVHYVAVGTFTLVDLMKDDENLISAFNKASFKKMPLFSTEEMDKLFDLYQSGLNNNGVPSDLRAEISKESCGHPASFMILLKLFHDFRPTVNQWGIRLQENLDEYMRTHIKIKHEINRMRDDEKRYVRRLTEHMADRWKMNLSDLTALNNLDKKLLDIGILYPMGKNLVGFTSCIILRVCIDALFSKPSSPSSFPSSPSSPTSEDVTLLNY